MISKMNDKVRVGIVGASTTGWAARSHIPALKLLPQFELTAISTTKMSSAQSAAQKFGAMYAFDSEIDLVNCPEVDLVVVAVKVPLHYQLVKTALEAGKMVYCEWPLGNGTGEAQALAALARAHNVRTFVGLQALALPETRFLQRVITEGLLGEVISSSLIGSGGSWAVVRDEASRYMLDPANGATMLTIPFGHTLAAYTAVLGQYKTVSALLARQRSVISLLTTGEEVPQLTDDQIVVAGRLAGGTVSVIHYRSGVSAGTNLLWEINGTKGDILITGGLGHYQLTPVRLQYAPTGGTLTPLAIPAEFLAADVVVPAQPVYGLYYAYRAVLDDLTHNTQLVPDFSAGLQLHRFLDTVQESALEGRTRNV